MTSNQKHQQWKIERENAFLSMDKEKILAYEKKYNIVQDEENNDEEEFWIGVHMGRTALVGLPVEERYNSIRWLVERGYDHYAFDLEIYK